MFFRMFFENYFSTFLFFFVENKLVRKYMGQIVQWGFSQSDGSAKRRSQLLLAMAVDALFCSVFYFSKSHSHK